MKKRIEYIDIFRAIGIILMVAGHVGFGNVFTRYIQSFHMPLFFLVTGFFYKETDFCTMMKKKGKTLLIPYYSFGIFFLLVIFLFKREIICEKLIATFFYSTEHFPISCAMWFLMALFVANVFYALIDKISLYSVKCIIIVLLAFFGELFTKCTGIILPFAICPALVGVGLIHIGRIMKKYLYEIANLKTYIWIPLGICGAVIGVTEGYVSMRTSSYPNVIAFWIGALLNSVCYLNIASMISKCLKYDAVKKWLCGIGEYSVVYVIFNELIIRILTAIMTVFAFPVAVEHFLVVVLTMICIFIIGKVFEKTFLRIFIGKF